MKKIFTISTYLFFINYAFAQQLTYSKVLYDTLSSGIQATGVVKSFHKGYMIIGEGQYGQQGLIMKVDTLGHHVVGNRISHYNNGAQPLISFYQTVATIDSNYAVCGSVYDSTTNLHRGMIIKFNDNGTILLAKQYAFSNASLTLTSLNQTNDSGFVICGYQTISNINHEFVAKTDMNGVLQWNKVINASGTLNDEATSVIQLPDSTIMLTGYHGGSPISAFLTKLNKNGTVLFSKQYLSNNNTPVKSTDIVLKNNNPYLLINDGNNSLIRIDLSGNMLWRKTYPGSSIYFNNYLNQTIYTRLHVSSDNGFYFISSGNYNNDFFKTDSLGNFQSSSSNFLSTSINVVQANDSGFFIVGNGPGVGSRSVYGSNNAPQIGIIKTDTSGAGVSNCLYTNTPSQPADSFMVSNILALTSGNAVESSLSLNSQTFYFETRSGCIDFTGGIATNKTQDITIYPNPTNSTIHVSINEQVVAIKIVDVLGNVLVEGNEKDIDVSSLANGVYFLQLASSMQKFIVQH